MRLCGKNTEPLEVSYFANLAAYFLNDLDFTPHAYPVGWNQVPVFKNPVSPRSRINYSTPVAVPQPTRPPTKCAVRNHELAGQRHQ